MLVPFTKVENQPLWFHHPFSAAFGWVQPSSSTVSCDSKNNIAFHLMVIPFHLPRFPRTDLIFLSCYPCLDPALRNCFLLASQPSTMKQFQLFQGTAVIVWEVCQVGASIRVVKLENPLLKWAHLFHWTSITSKKRHSIETDWLIGNKWPWLHPHIFKWQSLYYALSTHSV